MSVHMSQWGWPQWLMVGMWVASLSVHAGKNGEDAKIKYNFNMKMLGALVMFGWLCWGGFFP